MKKNKSNKINFKKYWNAIKGDFFKILKDPFRENPENTPKYEWETLHHFVYTIVIGRECENFPTFEEKGFSEEELKFYHRSGSYQKFFFFFKKFLKKYFSLFTEKRLIDLSDTEIVDKYLEFFEKFNISIKVISGIMCYVNENWIKKEKNFEKIFFFEWKRYLRSPTSGEVEYDNISRFEKFDMLKNWIGDVEYVKNSGRLKIFMLFLWEIFVFKKIREKILKQCIKRIALLRETEIRMFHENENKNFSISKNGKFSGTKELDSASSDIDESKILGIIKSFYELNKKTIFQNFFLKNFFESSNLFFRSKSIFLISRINETSGGGNDKIFLLFFKTVKKIFESEKKFVKKFCIPKSDKKEVINRIRELLIENFLKNNEKKIFEEKFKFWFKSENFEIFHKIFAILFLTYKREDENMSEMVETLQNKFCSTLEKFVVEKIVESFNGFFLITGKNKSTKRIVEFFIDSYLKYDKLFKETFDSNFKMMNVLKNSFKKIFEKISTVGMAGPSQMKNIKLEMLLAKYSNLVLRSNYSGGSLLRSGIVESEILVKISNIITLVGFVKEIDMFLKFFSIFLSKRLLTRKYNENHEFEMIKKLKLTCSYSIVYKFQKMFNDISYSEIINKRFEKIREKGKDGVKRNMKFLILTRGIWPLKRNMENFHIFFPKKITDLCESFQNFYKEEFSGRKLFFLYDKSYGNIITNIEFQNEKSKLKQYELILTTLEYTVLNVFNDHLSTEYKVLLKETNLPTEILNRSLRLLIRSKILYRDKKSKAIGININFYCKKRKIVINELNRLNKEEKNKGYENLEKLRNIQIQSAIIRIMKSRKKILILELVESVRNQSRKLFLPSIISIKKNIELLIDKGYVERDKKNLKQYHYIA